MMVFNACGVWDADTMQSVDFRQLTTIFCYDPSDFNHALWFLNLSNRWSDSDLPSFIHFTRCE